MKAMISSGLKCNHNEGSSKMFDNIGKQWDLITSINQVIYLLNFVQDCKVI